VYWEFGNGFYSVSSTRPTLGDDDALVAINDVTGDPGNQGRANQILQATEIHGNTIRTGTIEAAQIQTGTLTADLVDTFSLETQQLTIGEENDIFIEFITGTSVAGDIAIMKPSQQGGDLGTSTDRWQDIYTANLDVSNDITTDLINITPEFGDTDITISEINNISTIYPDTDNAGQVGSDLLSWDQMWAYEYIDANTGSAINDGGDPLAGLAEGSGPPEHAKRYSDDGSEAGYSLSEMARSVWEVCREQERVIEDQQDRIEKLEKRLSRLESQL
jgi:hypothetical protein